MSIIPPFVENILTTYLTPLLDWFSEYVYAALINRASDHLLVKLHAQLDLRPLEEACASFHHHAGPGRTPEHKVPQLVRALLVKYLYSHSLRAVETEIRFHFVVKWFVGYPLHAAGPDHTTLERFEQWVCQHQHRTFFDLTLRQIDQVFPQQRQQAQIGDTFAMHANAARESLLTLIRHLCRYSLCMLEKAAADRAAYVCTQIDHTALFGPDDEVDDYYLSAEQRAERLQATVCAALACARSMRDSLEQPTPLDTETRAPILHWLDLLDKALSDNIQITRDEKGQVTQASELPPKKKGSYRLGSATDPDATYRVHGSKCAFGYNVSVAANDQFVREIRADTGAQPDAVAVPDLIQAQRVHHDLTPTKLLYDAAAGSGKTRAKVAEVSDGQTQLSAPLMPYNKRTPFFSPDRFQLSADGSALTCPNGLTSTVSYHRREAEGRWFCFRASRCRGCPLWAQCREHKPTTKAPREVFISDFRSYVDAAVIYNQSEAYKADRKRRSLIEQTIAHLVRYNGARHARRRGQDAADFQAKMCATAYNLKRWIKLLPSAPGPTLPRE